MINMRNYWWEMLKVYQVCKNPLSVSEVVEMLRNPSEDKVSSLPPVKPKAGEVFIFNYSNSLQKGISVPWSKQEFIMVRRVSNFTIPSEK